MTPGRRYLVGVSAVAAAALLLSFVLPPEARTGVWLATALALLVQGPLGWWLVRAIGTERLQLVWAVGIAARFSQIGAAARRSSGEMASMARGLGIQGVARARGGGTLRSPCLPNRRCR